MLASSLVLSKAEVKKLYAAMTFAEEAAERARTAAADIDAAAWDAA
jgi:hypothetical protein